jgi:hypothetical protein
MMKSEVSIQQLLRWRLERAEENAPAPPRAALLIELARPWWERCPDVFRALAERLQQIPGDSFAHAMAEPQRGHPGHVVPTLITTNSGEREVYARILYFNIRDGQLRLRFHLEASTDLWQDSFEATLVAPGGDSPLLSQRAERSVDGEFHFEAGLPEELAESWQSLKVTDRMPFRLILRPVVDGA